MKTLFRAVLLLRTCRSRAGVTENGLATKARSAKLVSPQIICMNRHIIRRVKQQKISSSRKISFPQCGKKNML